VRNPGTVTDFRRKSVTVPGYEGLTCLPIVSILVIVYDTIIVEMEMAERQEAQTVDSERRRP